MGRLCGGAHEISGIKTPLFLWGGGGVGGDRVGCGGVVVVWYAGEGCCGWWTKGG